MIKRALTILILSFSFSTITFGQSNVVDSWPMGGDNIQSVQCHLLHRSATKLYKQVYVESNHFWYDTVNKTIDITVDSSTDKVQEMVKQLITLHQEGIDQGCIKFIPRGEVIGAGETEPEPT